MLYTEKEKRKINRLLDKLAKKEKLRDGYVRIGLKIRVTSMPQGGVD